MFPSLDSRRWDTSDLDTLASAMVADADADEKHSTVLGAGYTVFGQFLAHEISFDSSPLADSANPWTLPNWSEPSFELQSLYGAGPEIDSHLYSSSGYGYLALGTTTGAKAPGNFDIPRCATTGLGVIGDRRNDQNMLVAQLHVAFARFHNLLLKEHTDTQLSPQERFIDARTRVRWHFQWLVIHDYARKLVDEKTWESVKVKRARPFSGIPLRYMPVEFSGAAFRFGHSQIRKTYSLNSKHETVKLQRFFRNTGRASGKPLDDEWLPEWERFLCPEDRNFNGVRLMSTTLISETEDIPSHTERLSLAKRDLYRGAMLRIPSGQDCAGAMNIKPMKDGLSDHAKKFGVPMHLNTSTPLWYYILRESEAVGGEKLGQVGGTIVLSVLLGLLEEDKHSYLNQLPSWQPEILSGNPEDFNLMHMIEFSRGWVDQSDHRV